MQAFFVILQGVNAGLQGPQLCLTAVSSLLSTLPLPMQHWSTRRAGILWKELCHSAHGSHM